MKDWYEKYYSIKILDCPYCSIQVRARHVKDLSPKEYNYMFRVMGDNLRYHIKKDHPKYLFEILKKA